MVSLGRREVWKKGSITLEACQGVAIQSPHVQLVLLLERAARKAVRMRIFRRLGRVSMSRDDDRERCANNSM